MRGSRGCRGHALNLQVNAADSGRWRDMNIPLLNSTRDILEARASYLPSVFVLHNVFPVETRQIAHKSH